MTVYLDNAATTPVDRRVVKKMLPFFEQSFGNASSRDHRYGWDAEQAVEEARYHVAHLIGAKTSQIIFTSCATESINLALKGVAYSRDKRRSIITTTIEHEAVLATCQRLESDHGFDINHLPVDSHGHLHIEQAANLIHQIRPCLVSVMWGNNEIGTIHPVRRIARLAHDAGAIFFTDATQTVGKTAVNVNSAEIDLMAFSAHKMYGPMGVGALFVKNSHPPIRLTTQLDGGGHEHGVRSGTLNVPGIVGFGESCRIAKKEMTDEIDRTKRLRDRFEKSLLSRLENVSVNGSSSNRLPHITNIRVEGIDAKRLIRTVDGVALSTSSACATRKKGPSHVLEAIGLTEQQSYSSFRASIGRFTTEAEIDWAVEQIALATERLANRS